MPFYHGSTIFLLSLSTPNQKQNQWDDIREHFIEDDYHSYSTGNFNGEEARDPAKLILDLIQQVIKCKEGVFQKLEVRPRMTNVAQSEQNLLSIIKIVIDYRIKY